MSTSLDFQVQNDENNTMAWLVGIISMIVLKIIINRLFPNFLRNRSGRLIHIFWAPLLVSFFLMSSSREPAAHAGLILFCATFVGLVTVSK